MPAILIKDIQIGDNIDCSLYGPVNNSTGLVGKVIGITNADGLPATSVAPTDHVNIYPLLPASVQSVIENDYRSYNYIAVKLLDSNVVYVGLPWIIESTLIREDIGLATIKVVNFRDTDIEPIKALLKANGYTVDSVEIATV